MTNDPRLIALVGVGLTLPWLVLSLPLGVVIDRLDRKVLMVRANIARCALFALIAALASTGDMSIGILIAIITLVGVCEVVFDMSAQAFLPAIVPAEMLERANGRLFATEVVCNTFLGLPLGAWAFVAAIGTPFAVNAASFGVAAYLVASIRTTIPSSGTATSEPASKSFTTQLADGLRWLFAHRLLRTMAVMLGICNLATMMGQALFVKYASDELGVTGGGYGVLLAVMSAGSILGGLAGDRVASKFGTSTTIIVSYSTFATASLAMGLWRNIPVAVAASAATSIAGTVWNVATVSLRQRIILRIVRTRQFRLPLHRHGFHRGRFGHRRVHCQGLRLRRTVSGRRNHHDRDDRRWRAQRRSPRIGGRSVNVRQSRPRRRHRR